MVNTFYPWPKIQQFKNITKAGRKYLAEDLGPVPYVGKIKLHGTNGAVTVYTDGTYSAQSRKRLIQPGNDNMDFAAFIDREVGDQLKYISSKNEVPYTIYGEWCGPKIQDNVAVSQLPNRVFAVFAVVVHLTEHDLDGLVTDPGAIKQFVPLHEHIHVLPVHNTIQVDFHNSLQLAACVESLCAEVDKIDTEDPWVKDTFGISGVGEGIVYIPDITPSHALFPYWRDYMFKVKGASHSKSRVIGKPASLSVEVLESIAAFVTMYCTEDRLQQGITEVFEGEDFDIKGLGMFIGWVCRDVKTEGADELEASGFTWKQCSSYVAQAAREWFKERYV